MFAFSGAENLSDPFQIWIINQDSSHVYSILNVPFKGLYPCWSPDGRTLAYVEQPSQDASCIVMIDALTFKQVEVTPVVAGNLYSLQWHPSKPLVACTSALYDPYRSTILVYDGEAQRFEPLFDQDYVLGWLSPLWNMLLYTSKEAERIQISLRQLPDLTLLHTWMDEDWEPVAWSPTSQHVALYFMVQDGEQDQGSLGILDLQTYTIERCTTMAPDGMVAWSPDATKIVFFRGDIGRYRLAVLDVQTKCVTDICLIHPNDPGETPPPQITWSSDSSSLYTYSYIDTQFFILAIDSVSYTVEQITPLTRTYQLIHGIDAT